MESKLRERTVVAAPRPEGESSTRLFVADRAGREEVKRQSELVGAHPLTLFLLDSMSTGAFVLNARRQIVYGNRSFRTLLGERGLPWPLGKRIGEALGCANADLPPSGCGTTEACRLCAAAAAMKAAFRGCLGVRECRLRVRGGRLAFRMSASPIDLGGEAFLLCTLVDFRAEERPALDRGDDQGRCRPD